MGADTRESAHGRLTVKPHAGWGTAAGTYKAPTPLGIALRRMREARSLSQSELARLAGCDNAHISRLESGNRAPTREMVGEIADALVATELERCELLLSSGYCPPELVDAARLLAALPTPARGHIEGLMRTMTGDAA